jgi:hypothetical protein
LERGEKGGVLKKDEVLEAQLHVVCNCVFKSLIFQFMSRGQVADVIGGRRRLSRVGEDAETFHLHFDILYQQFSSY